MRSVLSCYTIELCWYRRRVGSTRRMDRIDVHVWSLKEPRHA